MSAKVILLVAAVAAVMAAHCVGSSSGLRVISRERTDGGKLGAFSLDEASQALALAYSV